MPTRIARLRLQPRKMPVQPRSAHTVESIVEAAARILESGGLAALNTNAVAERAGLSVGSLYQYFPSKDALVAALSRRERAMLMAEIVAATEGAAGLSLEATLRRLVRAAIHRQLARPALARILDFEEQRLGLDPADLATSGGIAAVLEAVLTPHRRRLGRQRLDEAALDLMAMTRALIDAAAARGAIDPKSLERRILRAALGYLGGRANVAP
ncbi:MAG: TetR/AcrR family transcriptional regulator [Reyranellaceae bacterium]